MIRRWWLAAAAAQVAVVGQVQTGKLISESTGFIRTKPAPDECPVCGKMAKPYIRVPAYIWPEYDTEANEKWLREHPGETRTWFYTKDKHGPLAGDPSAITRCAHCNAAFWQDAR